MTLSTDIKILYTCSCIKKGSIQMKLDQFLLEMKKNQMNKVWKLLKLKIKIYFLNLLTKSVKS